MLISPSEPLHEPRKPQAGGRQSPSASDSSLEPSTSDRLVRHTIGFYFALTLYRTPIEAEAAYDLVLATPPLSPVGSDLHALDERGLG